MKPQVTERNVVVRLPNQQKRFTIDANAQAFRILSSNLYSNVTTAIVRELCCNAYDAHVMVGKEDQPFELSFPSTLSPNFVVRDFGPGLSHEDTMDLYTTYFGSNKRHTNDLIGGLGLGSKSPFAYVDTFSVISRQNGHARTYSTFIDDEGMPNITLMGEKNSSDEQDGLEVIVPVKPNDFSRFMNVAKSVLVYFPVTPPGIVIEKPTPQMETRNARVYGGMGYGDKQKVIMGNVPYEIPSDFLSELDDSKYKIFKTIKLELIAPVGSLNFQPSREALSMDKHTRESLLNLLDKAKGQIMSELYSRLRNEQDKLKAVALARTFGRDRFTWKGKEVKVKTNFNCDYFKYDGWRDLKLCAHSGLSVTEARNHIVNGSMYILTHRHRLRDVLDHNDIGKEDCLFLKSEAAAREIEEYLEYPSGHIQKVSDAMEIPKIQRASSGYVKASFKYVTTTYRGQDWNEMVGTVDDFVGDKFCWVDLEKNDFPGEYHRHVQILSRASDIKIVGVPRTIKHMDKHMKCRYIKEAMLWWWQKFCRSDLYDLYTGWTQYPWVVNSDFRHQDHTDVRELIEARPTITDFLHIVKTMKEHDSLFGSIKNGVTTKMLKLPARQAVTTSRIVQKFMDKYPVLVLHAKEGRWNTVYLNRFAHYIQFIERRRVKP